MYCRLTLLVAQVGLVAIRMGGVVEGSTPEVIYVHGVYVFEKSRNGPKTTLNRVYHALLFFDTS